MLAKDYLEEFKVECDLRRLSTRTTKSYYNSTALFLNFLDKHLQIRELESIRPPHVKKYIQYLLDKKLSPSYINGILKCLRAFFKYAFNEGYISANPTLKVSWQREGKVLINTFTDDEVRSLLDAFNMSSYLSARNKLILAIAFDTGARNTEICSIQEEDIRDNVILIHGKGNKERHVPLTPYLKKLLIKYLRIKQFYFDDKIIPYRNLLLSRTGNPLTKEALEHIFKQAASKATIRSEIRCSPHTARHYYAQANLRNGLDVYSLSRLLGHENINITKRYLQSLQDSSIVELAVNTSPLRNIRI